MFPSTYICESSFSVMHIIKKQDMNRLSSASRSASQDCSPNITGSKEHSGLRASLMEEVWNSQDSFPELATQAASLPASDLEESGTSQGRSRTQKNTEISLRKT
ncbi:hypothetical protein PO909_030204 [Leuciscus waleckii]